MTRSASIHRRALSVISILPGTEAFAVSPLGTMAIYD